MMVTIQTRRRTLLQLGAAGLIYPIVTQARGFFSMKKEIMVDVLVFNYLNRPIFDVYLNGAMVGASASLSDSPYGQFGTVAGVTVQNGPQKLTWRLSGPGGMPHNGDTVAATNAINVSVAELPKRTETLGVHIYPDYTAELVFSDEMAHQSPRGMTYAKKYQKDGK